MTTPQENYLQLLKTIEIQKKKSSISQNILLLAVSKTVEITDMLPVYYAGARHFGESRPQEIARKAPLLPCDCQWHMIGHLQKNKVRQVLTYASWIHSVDSLELLQRINLVAEEMQLKPNILLEVNISGEISKDGFSPEQIRTLSSTIHNYHHVSIKGLMTMAPFDANTTELHQIFHNLRSLRDQLSQEWHIPLTELSMGMSHDYQIAIEEGATIVRIGSTLFGDRIYNHPL